MMKSAEEWLGNKLAERLDRPTARRILVQGHVRSEFVAVTGVGCKDPAQMSLEDDDVIEAFPPDRADAPRRMSTLLTTISVPPKRFIAIATSGRATPREATTR